MKTQYIFLLFVIFASFSCSRATEQDSKASKPVQVFSLPDNPCEVLNPAQVSAITGLEVISAKRVPSIEKIVNAQSKNREPSPGTICSYETRSEFGAIMIVAPVRADRHAAKYWKTRAKYFETFPGAGQPVAGLGKDAWLSGGNALHVLVGGDEYFTLSTQMYQPRSRDLLVKIAKVMLHRSSRSLRSAGIRA
jgi:hypothetical protein